MYCILVEIFKLFQRSFDSENNLIITTKMEVNKINTMSLFILC